MPPRNHRSAQGFTLIELGAIIAVTAILAAAIMPDFIEAARNRMAQKSAEDVATIHDAARWFYIDSAKTKVDSDRGRWPGQQNRSECKDATSPLNPHIADLKKSHHLIAFPTNPWDRPYETRLRPGYVANGQQWGCAFEVATDVPQPLAQAFSSFLPQSTCQPGQCMPNSTPLPSGDWARCCSVVPPPGTGMCMWPLVARMDPATPGDLRLKCLPPLP